MANSFPQGQAACLDEGAESKDPSLPAFLSPPDDAPVYHGFPLLGASERDGYVFGLITNPKSDPPARWGDAYVVAPDGSRAGIVWQCDGDPSPVVCEASPGRWGVYAFRFDGPVRDERDLLRNLHAVLPQLKAYYAQALANRPESAKGDVAGRGRGGNLP